MKRRVFGLLLLTSPIVLKAMHEYTPILREQLDLATTKYQAGPNYWVIYNIETEKYYGETPRTYGKHKNAAEIQARLKAYYIHLKKQYYEQFYKHSKKG